MCVVRTKVKFKKEKQMKKEEEEKENKNRVYIHGIEGKLISDEKHKELEDEFLGWVEKEKKKDGIKAA
jgi:hypothetical protein